MESLRLILRLLFWIFVGVLAVTFFMRDRLPPKEQIQTALIRDPVQEETTKEPFSVTVEGMQYTVSPLYTYDLVGLVVSEHRTDALFDYYHRLWNDSFNVKDVCVVWGNNVRSGIYKDMQFKSGSWTCYYRTSNEVVWRAFAPQELSNNHLLTASPEIQKVLRSIRRGDQIRIKGYLANYSHAGGFTRGTSITRTDTNNGACETIYISEIQLLQEANSLARRLFTFSAYLLAVLLVLRTALYLVSVKNRIKKIDELVN